MKFEKEKIVNCFKGSILLATIILTGLIWLISFLLEINDIAYRQWFYYLIVTIVYLGFIIGIAQIAHRVENKNIKSLIRCTLTIIISLSIPVILFWSVFGIKPEHIVKKDGKKYVVYVYAFKDVNAIYYDYINEFFRGSKRRISEDYGSGGYDPFTEEFKDYEPKTTYYYKYDSNGNRIYEK